MNEIYQKRLIWEQEHPEVVEWSRQKGANYWLFSKSTEAGMCRCRNEVPLGVVGNLNEQEAAAVCEKIRKGLESGHFYDIWVYVLVYFKDTSALPVLEACVKRYKALDRDAAYEIRALKDAIRYLKRV